MAWETLKKQVHDVLQYSQHLPEVKTDNIVDEWALAKKEIIEDVFDGKLIWEYPEKVIFHLSPEEREYKVVKMLDKMYYLFSDFGEYELYDTIAKFIGRNTVSFFDNKVSDNTGCDIKKVPIGMKLGKALGYFIENPELLDAVQTDISRCIQEDKIEGRLCLSVHPLDYLSSSENTHNWRSCHALDGEYRAGNLSYMLDSSTIICYLKSEEDAKLPNFPEHIPWNNKKWRVLLFLSDNWEVIFASRQYPFSSQTGLDHLLHIFSNLIRGKSMYSNWRSELLTKMTTEDGYSYNLRSKYIVVRGEFIELPNMVEDADGSMHFNDLLKSSCYTPQYVVHNDTTYAPSLKHEKVHIGSSCPCIYCGESDIDLDDAMICCDCDRELGYSDNDDYFYCDCCGRREFREDGYWVEDMFVCDHCFNTEVITCDQCGEAYFEENIEREETTGRYLCKWCAEHPEEE